MKLNSILEAIGNTPHLRINRLFQGQHQIWMKLERANPGASIKDRIALAMINDAEERGLINKQTTIIEPTSGNTGIGLAFVAAVKGYKLLLVMPESMSIERRKIMAAYGASLVLTPRELGMKGAIEKAKEIHAQTANSWIPQQFDNQANVQAHIKTTAEEILRDFPEGLDYIITGVGTGGHITACARLIKQKFSGLKVLAVEPSKSPVLSGGAPSPHPIQGIGAGFIPSIMDTSLLDGIIQVDHEKAYEYVQRCAKEEGVLIGVSSGASLAAIEKFLPELKPDSKVLTFCYDTGERYLSIEGLFT